MKKLLFILICLSIIGFYSCDSNKPEWRKNKEKYNKIMKEERIAMEEMMRKYEKIVKNELQKDTIISKIILGFKYGESKESVNQKTSNLLANGKISKWLETDTLVYKFLDGSQFINQNLTSFIDFKYMNNKLYEVKLKTYLNYISDDNLLYRGFYDNDITYELAKIKAITKEGSKHRKNRYKIFNYLEKIYEEKFPSSLYKSIKKYESITYELAKTTVLETYFICANNQIKIHSNGNSVDIIYQDLKVLEERKKIENERKKSEDERNRIEQLQDL